MHVPHPRAGSDLPPRVLFLTRDPVFHQRSGSTTYIDGLLRLLLHRGVEVTLLSTVAASRAPRLLFRLRVPRPAALRFHAPGYLRFGTLYLRLHDPKAWARAAVRAAARHTGLARLTRWMERLWGTALYAGAWDLTPPTQREGALAARFLHRTQASTVLANYCMWGDWMRGAALAPRCTAILMHDLLSARVQRFQQSGKALDMPLITAEQEMRWLAAADLVLAAQEQEAEQVRMNIGPSVQVAPVLLRPRALPASKLLSHRCLFVGSDIEPNRDALHFLLTEVWPMVRNEVASATLAVAGSVGRGLGAARRPHELAAQGIEVLGIVPELEDEYARAAVCLVPLRMGTGIKIKLLEALSYGKALVTTSVGVQGLESWAHDGLPVQDEAAAFARQICSLLGDPVLRAEQEERTLALAVQHFGPERPLDEVFQRVFLRPHPGPERPVS